MVTRRGSVTIMKFNTRQQRHQQKTNARSETVSYV